MISISLVVQTAMLCFAFSFFSMPLKASADACGNTEAGYTQLRNAEQSSLNEYSPTRAAAIIHVYSLGFPASACSEALRSMPSKDLNFLIRATDIALLYSRDDAHLEILQKAYAELEKREESSDILRAEWYGALVGMRAIPSARELLLRYPQLKVEPIPSILAQDRPDPASPLAYATTDQASVLQEVQVPIHEGTRWVIVAHPLCAFSRRAMLALAQDPVLAPILARHATWVAPADRSFHAGVITTWNQAHPETPLVIAHDPGQWPQIDDWATPSFHLLHGGVKLGTVSGWPQAGNRDALLALWQRRPQSSTRPAD